MADPFDIWANAVARALEAGMPEDEAAMAGMLAQAEADAERADRQRRQRPALEQHLVDSGRANRVQTPGVRGGKTSPEAQALAEASAGRVLASIEKGTQQNQRATDPQAPLSHAVSAHGPGTDQVSRLVDGRRNDEIQADRERELAEKRQALADIAAHESGKKPLSAKALAEKRQIADKPERETIRLEGNAEVGDVEIPKYDTVGSDPKNVSGAFTTNQGMLHVVGEAFAQADMLSRHADGRAKPGEPRVDGRRVAMNLDGRGGKQGPEELGYNLEVQGLSGQRSKVKDGPDGTAEAPMAGDEVVERYKTIKKTGGLDKARVVLDPAYVDGKRAGWNIQTAYANQDEATESYANPDAIEDTVLAVESERMAKVKAAKLAHDDRDKAVQKVAAKEGDILAKRQVLATDAESLVAAPQDALHRTKEALEAALAAKEKSVKAVRDELATYGEEAGDPDDVGMDLFALDDAPQEPAVQRVLSAEEEAARAAARERLDALERETRDLEAWIDTRKVEERKLDMEAKIAKAQQELVGLRQAVAEKEAEIPRAEEAAQKAKEAERLKREQVGAKAAADDDATGDAAQDGVNEPGADGDAADEDGDGAGTGMVSGYNVVTGEFDGDRPPKPRDALRGKDDAGDALTAHHLYPWNKLKSDLNRALNSRKRSTLEKLLAVDDIKVPAWFWDEFQKPPPQRPYKFGEEVNRLAQKVCWAPSNVFMGPLNTKRGDDPGEKLDAAFTKSGLPTPASAAAEATARTGGIGASVEEAEAAIQADIEARFLSRLKVASVGKLEPADKKKLRDALARAGVRKAVESAFVERAGKRTRDDLDSADKLKLRAELIACGDPTATAEEYLESLGKTSMDELDQTQRAELEDLLRSLKGRRQRLAEHVAANAREAQDGKAREYDASEWVDDEQGKKVRRKRADIDPMLRVPPAVQHLLAEAEGELEVAAEWIDKAKNSALPKSPLEHAQIALDSFQRRFESGTKAFGDNPAVAEKRAAIKSGLAALEEAISVR